MNAVRIVISSMKSYGSQTLNISSMGAAIFNEVKADGTPLRRMRIGAKPHEVSKLITMFEEITSSSTNPMWEAEILYEDGKRKTISSSTAGPDEITEYMRDIFPADHLWGLE